MCVADMHSDYLLPLLQGLACYLVEQFGQDAARVRGVIVGYDARHNSLRYCILQEFSTESSY